MRTNPLNTHNRLVVPPVNNADVDEHGRPFVGNESLTQAIVDKAHDDATALAPGCGNANHGAFLAAGVPCTCCVR